MVLLSCQARLAGFVYGAPAGGGGPHRMLYVTAAPAFVSLVSAKQLSAAAFACPYHPPRAHPPPLLPGSPRAAKRHAHPAAASSSSSVEAAGGPPTPVRLGWRRPDGPGGGSLSVWLCAPPAAAQPRQRLEAWRLERPLLRRGPAALAFMQRFCRSASHGGRWRAVCTLLSLCPAAPGAARPL